MPPFKSPEPKYNFALNKEKAAISRHFTKREVPRRKPDRLLLATWNIANLGAQERTRNACSLISHILKRFDLIAVQEVNDNFKVFASIVQNMGPSFDYIMTDTAGNNERLAYVFRKNKVRTRKLFGELALRLLEYPSRTVKVRWVDRGRQKRVQTFKKLKFIPFDRNPFIASFSAGSINFTLVNVHLYFGEFQNSKTEKERRKYARRVLEIYALSRWADRRFNKNTTYDKDIVLLGDMNIPEMNPRESTYKALVKFGWNPVNYVYKRPGSNLGNNKTYDQMAFAPGSIGRRLKKQSVFDFDNAVFRPLWKDLTSRLSPKKAAAKFRMHVKHHLSDHRPLWVELDIG